MAWIRGVVTLAVLMLCFAPMANAQSPVGPLCLRAEINNPSANIQLFEIFALPMGTTSSASQFLLSAVQGGDLAFTGTAAVVGQVARFTLTRYDNSKQDMEAFGGFVNLGTGTGIGHCARIDRPTALVCGGDSVDYTLVDCE